VYLSGGDAQCVQGLGVHPKSWGKKEEKKGEAEKVINQRQFQLTQPSYCLYH
jgi:hypothetical protein